MKPEEADPPEPRHDSMLDKRMSTGENLKSSNRPKNGAATKR